MDEIKKTSPRPTNPRRRRRTKMDIFKESYLPYVIITLTIIFIIVTIIGASSQNAQRKKQNDEAAQAAAAAAQAEAVRLNAEAEKLIAEAQAFAVDYYYDEAIATLEKFSGDITKFQKLSAQLQVYRDNKSKMVTWNVDQVINLSFHVLIEDPLRAYPDSRYGTNYNRNFITTSEFRLILDQLYSNGYILVNIDDFVVQSQSEGKTQFQAKTLQLPEGKKPLILTQTHVNYYRYMTDGNGDSLPDKDGDGFASKLVVDGNGKILNEMVDKNGNTVTGEFDLIPILNSYIEAHPDFSYRGARAVIAVTGYEGVFGYRTNPGAKEYLSADSYNKEVEGAKKIAQALRDNGYTIACYTYDNLPYGDIGIATLKEDLAKWKQEVTPILGNVDTLVFAFESDLSKNSPYSGDKFNALMEFGFRYYLGFCSEGKQYVSVQPGFFQQDRLMVTGGYLKYYSQWFEGILDPLQILSSVRGTIPEP